MDEDFYLHHRAFTLRSDEGVVSAARLTLGARQPATGEEVVDGYMLLSADVYLTPEQARKLAWALLVDAAQLEATTERRP